MGIALPSWIVAGKNNIWVLGAYALIFGGALPGLVVSVILSLVVICGLHIVYRANGGSVTVRKQRTVSMPALLLLSSKPLPRSLDRKISLLRSEKPLNGMVFLPQPNRLVYLNSRNLSKNG